MQPFTVYSNMASRVRTAVRASAWGPSLFPSWEFTTDDSSLTVSAPRAPMAASWEWEEDMDDASIALAIEMLVQMYLEDLRDEWGMDLTPATS